MQCDNIFNHSPHCNAREAVHLPGSFHTITDVVNTINDAVCCLTTLAGLNRDLKNIQAKRTANRKRLISFS